MSRLICTLQGRFGNQCMSWLFAYAFAKENGMEFRCERWVGEKIFDLPPYQNQQPSDALKLDAMTFLGASRSTWRGGEEYEFRDYAQRQECMIYTKREAQQWLKFRPEIEAACVEPCYSIVGHRRVGDYVGYGYPVVSEMSYIRACDRFGLDPKQMVIHSEELPTISGQLPQELGFVMDFFKMARARTLLRGNSTFSWVAALLGNGLVLSPVIDGLPGGEHDCQFVAGNHPRLASFDFTTDLFVAP